jgi:hypothetical protein
MYTCVMNYIFSCQCVYKLDIKPTSKLSEKESRYLIFINVITKESPLL